LKAIKDENLREGSFEARKEEMLNRRDKLKEIRMLLNGPEK